MIKILITDDHPMVRTGLETVLSLIDDFDVCGMAGNGMEAYHLCGQMEPDVILMDLKMPKMDGVTAIEKILEKWPDLRIIVLTSFPEEDLIEKALDAGAMSYLLKDITANRLEQAIRAAFHYQSTLAPEATRVLMEKARKPKNQFSPGDDLTAREKEVLNLMTEGLNNPNIAERLFISRATVSVHVSKILSKLGVSNRVEAVTLSMRLQLV